MLKLLVGPLEDTSPTMGALAVCVVSVVRGSTLPVPVLKHTEGHACTHTPGLHMYTSTDACRDTHKSKHTHAHMYTCTHTRNPPKPFQTLGPWESGLQAVKC